MTWPEGIALAIGILTAYLLNHHPRSTTEQPDPQDGTGERP
ncbi:MAG TPA: hypothetical protein VGL02_12665 [Streptomyces sp.]